MRPQLTKPTVSLPPARSRAWPSTIARGEHLGSVYNFMVDKFTGCVAYAVMSFEGFLGIGERYHPLPWKVLTYDPRLGGYVVDLTRDQLEKAPHYALEDTPWADPKYGRSVYDYYNVPWYM